MPARVKLFMGAPSYSECMEDLALTVDELVPAFEQHVTSFSRMPTRLQAPVDPGDESGEPPKWRSLAPHQMDLATSFSELGSNRLTSREHESSAARLYRISLEQKATENIETRQNPCLMSSDALKQGSNLSEETEIESFIERSFVMHESREASGEGDKQPPGTTALDISLDQELERISAALTMLKSIPNAQALDRLNPQTVTVNLLVGIISVPPLRTMHIRKTGREVDLMELTVGDDTRAGFQVTFWLDKPGLHPRVGEDMRRPLASLRPGDVVLIRNVALTQFKGQVHGQSRWTTNIRTLYRWDQPIDLTKPDGGNKAISAAEMRLQAVRGWTRRFITPAARFHDAISFSHPRKRRSITRYTAEAQGYDLQMMAAARALQSLGSGGHRRMAGRLSENWVLYARAGKENGTPTCPHAAGGRAMLHSYIHWGAEPLIRGSCKVYRPLKLAFPVVAGLCGEKWTPRAKSPCSQDLLHFSAIERFPIDPPVALHQVLDSRNSPVRLARFLHPSTSLPRLCAARQQILTCARQALILVGGFGTRLRPLVRQLPPPPPIRSRDLLLPSACDGLLSNSRQTLTLPKPLVEFANKPMIQHQVESLAAAGVTDIVLAVNYRPEIMVNALKKVNITFSVETEPLGTAGPLKLAEKILGKDDAPFFVLNSDVTCEYPFKDLAAFHKSHGEEGTIVVTKVEEPKNYGVVVMKPNHPSRIDRFVEKPVEFVGNRINAGIYILNPSVLRRIELRPTSIEQETFPAIVKDGQLHSFDLEGFWMDVGQPKDFLAGTCLYLSSLAKHNSKLLTDPTKESFVHGGNVMIDPTAKVGKNCKIGPNVTIGPGVTIGDGVRLQRCVLLANCKVKEHAWIKSTIVGWNSTVGRWARLENVTVLGDDVTIGDEIYVNGGSVLPHKSIKANVEGECYILIVAWQQQLTSDNSAGHHHVKVHCPLRLRLLHPPSIGTIFLLWHCVEWVQFAIGSWDGYMLLIYVSLCKGENKRDSTWERWKRDKAPRQALLNVSNPTLKPRARSSTGCEQYLGFRRHRGSRVPSWRRLDNDLPYSAITSMRSLCKVGLTTGRVALAPQTSTSSRSLWLNAQRHVTHAIPRPRSSHHLTWCQLRYLHSTQRQPAYDVDGAAREADAGATNEELSHYDKQVAADKEKQIRTPWMREGSDKPPVHTQRSAGAMTKGKLLTTPSRLLKLVLPLSTRDTNSDRKDVEPLALLVHPQQPLSYLERLIQAELPMMQFDDQKRVPNVNFRAVDAMAEDAMDPSKDQDLDEYRASKKGKLRGAPGEGGVESYSGSGREAREEEEGDDPSEHFVRWSKSTEIGDFIRDAARGKEFAVEIEGAPREAGKADCRHGGGEEGVRHGCAPQRTARGVCRLRRHGGVGPAGELADLHDGPGLGCDGARHVPRGSGRAAGRLRLVSVQPARGILPVGDEPDRLTAAECRVPEAGIRPAALALGNRRGQPHPAGDYQHCQRVRCGLGREAGRPRRRGRRGAQESPTEERQKGQGRRQGGRRGARRLMVGVDGIAVKRSAYRTSRPWSAQTGCGVQGASRLMRHRASTGSGVSATAGEGAVKRKSSSTYMQFHRVAQTDAVWCKRRGWRGLATAAPERRSLPDALQLRPGRRHTGAHACAATGGQANIKLALERCFKKQRLAPAKCVIETAIYLASCNLHFLSTASCTPSRCTRPRLQTLSHAPWVSSTGKTTTWSCFPTMNLRANLPGTASHPSIPLRKNQGMFCVLVDRLALDANTACQGDTPLEHTPRRPAVRLAAAAAAAAASTARQALRPPPKATSPSGSGASHPSISSATTASCNPQRPASTSASSA
ncbi:hypothetical protein FH972_021296 [Carpinus fangiana]|uniref:Mannose-1-phosphate guanyltransferase n=1 Tax=Carpinus fangiana TaxID=176857 RepID=A0A5N6KNX9_9ROSI|nr:hypothetical protein FH972_021296 [Carpinus fangiana]